MIDWKNLDKLSAFEKLSALKNHVNLPEAMAGESGAKRVAAYSVPMAAGLTYNFAAKAVDDDVLAALAELASEAQLTEKYAALYNGEVINTGEKRLVLHQLTRGQLGDAVVADGVDKREFYVAQQKKAAGFAAKVHAGEITNAAGEKFTTVVQIGIGGSDLGPRAMYLALENWARQNGSLKMEARKYVKQSEAAARKSAPYRKLQQFAAGRRREAMQRDLAESLSYVKNLVVIGRGENMSAQLLLEELSELSKDLGPVFLSMARSIQMFDKETAARQLFEALPFSYAKDIGEFLAGWEDIPPSDLLNTVEVYRSALREDRLTRQKRWDETISDLVYFPVVVNSMVVLLNFIYVAYFLQQKDALSVLFN